MPRHGRPPQADGGGRSAKTLRGSALAYRRAFACRRASSSVPRPLREEGAASSRTRSPSPCIRTAVASSRSAGSARCSSRTSASSSNGPWPRRLHLRPALNARQPRRRPRLPSAAGDGLSVLELVPQSRPLGVQGYDRGTSARPRASLLGQSCAARSAEIAGRDGREWTRLPVSPVVRLPS